MRYCDYCGELLERRAKQCATCGKAADGALIADAAKVMQGGAAVRQAVAEPVAAPEAAHGPERLDLTDTLPRPALYASQPVMRPASKRGSVSRGILIFLLILSLIVTLLLMTINYVGRFDYGGRVQSRLGRIAPHAYHALF